MVRTSAQPILGDVSAALDGVTVASRTLYPPTRDRILASALRPYVLFCHLTPGPALTTAFFPGRRQADHPGERAQAGDDRSPSLKCTVLICLTATTR